MISLTLLSIFIATFAFFWYFLKPKEDPKGFKKIPGPSGWPLLGNALQLDKLSYKTFSKWTDQYGPVYQMRLGTTPNVIVSDPKLIKEMFLTDPNYIARPSIKKMEMMIDDRLGVVNAEGELWEVHRRFLLRSLRDFGFGKAAMEGQILEEVEEVISTFKKSGTQPIKDIKKTLTLAVINSLWTIVSSKRYKHDDPKLLGLIANANKVMDELAGSIKLMLILVLPWMQNLMPSLTANFLKAFNGLGMFYQEQIDEHKRDFQEDNLKDFIDVYLNEIKKASESDSPSIFRGPQAERQLMAVLSDLFFAGSDTTSSTLSWAILYLSKYPEAQKKLQDEIYNISGNSRMISVADRPNMPYTLAVMDEIFRRSSIVPTGVQHRALEGKEFHGYWIPKDTWVWANLHHIHHNPLVWDDPYSFKPERFIDSGKYKKSDFLLPFQIGRRQCVGETMARDTIFLFLTNIFQKFTIQLDPQEPEPSLESKPGFILSPQPYSVVMTERL